MLSPGGNPSDFGTGPAASGYRQVSQRNPGGPLSPDGRMGLPSGSHLEFTFCHDGTRQVGM